MSHLTEQNRKDISSMLAHNKKCVEIANAIGCDPTTIAKEIKLNRIISKEAKTKGNKILCKRLERFPYVCLACPHKYTSCTLTQLKYDARVAQKKYEFRLHETRKGINLTKEEYDSLNHQLKEGLLNKRSVYEIVKTSKIDVSVSTVYRYISEKKVNITKMDLPYAVTYKKEKR